MSPAGFKLAKGQVHVKGRGTDQANALIKRAEELGIDASEIITTSVGYLVPEALVQREETAQAGEAKEDQTSKDQDQSQDTADKDLDQGQDTADKDLEAYDPTKHTVDDVVEYLAGVDEAERDRVIAVEKESSKPRKGILELADTGEETK